MLLLTYRDQVLLTKRPPKGIWGGLWVLPMFDHFDELKTWLIASGLSNTELHIHPQRQHLFTHFRLQYTPVQITLPRLQQIAKHQWHRLGDVDQLGLPKPVKVLLSELECA